MPALLAFCACAHSESYVPATWVVGPFSASPDVQLTFNVDQDYWPTWTLDGKGILYAYVDQQFPQHRCLGILPPVPAPVPAPVSAPPQISEAA